MAKRATRRRRGTRRYRKNPVLAIPASVNPRRRRSRRRYRSNAKRGWQLYRYPARSAYHYGGASGKFRKRRKGKPSAAAAATVVANPRRRRRRRHYAANVSRRAPRRRYAKRRSSARRNPYRGPWSYHRKGYRVPGGRVRVRRHFYRKPRYRRNPILPFPVEVGLNPYAGNNVLAGVIAPFQKAIDLSFVTGELLPMAGGYFGSKAVGRMASDLVGVPYDGVYKYVANLVGAGVLSTGVSMLLKDSAMASRVLGGGLFAIFVDLLKDIGVTGALGIGDLGDISDSMKSQIVDSVRAQLHGTDDYLTYEAYGGSPRLADYASAEALNAAPHLAQAAGGVASMATYVDEFSDAQLV